MPTDDDTRQIALNLQSVLTAWSELHPDDSDEDACRKSRAIVEAALKAHLKALVPRATEERPKMPTLPERLRIVMGKDNVTIPDAIERLGARDPTWVPVSTDLGAYISLTLAANTKDIFERVSRGIYRVRPGVSPEHET